MIEYSLGYTRLKALSYLLVTLATIGLSLSLWAEEGKTCTLATKGTFLQYTDVIYSTDCYTEDGRFPGILISDEGLLLYAFANLNALSPTPVTASLNLGSFIGSAKKASGVNDPAGCQNAMYVEDKVPTAPSTGYCVRRLLDSGEYFYMYAYTDDSGTLADGKFFTSPSNNIAGNWIAEGYTCKGQPLSEQKVKISEKGDVFTAVKLVGDDCAPTGYATFRWDSKKDICHLIELTNPGELSTQSMNFTACTLKRTDKDNFKIVLPDRDNYTLSFQKEGVDSSLFGESLVGTWSSGYECNGQRSMRRINIELNGTVATAFRQDGDDCMPAGYIQFYQDLDSGVCQWVGADMPDISLDTTYKCEMSLNTLDDLFTLSFPENKERKEIVFRKIAGISHNPTKVAENLSIQIPYAEYQMSPTQTRTIQGNLELVPSSDGTLLWKMSSADFLD